jgi:hypothetical protein
MHGGFGFEILYAISVLSVPPWLTLTRRAAMLFTVSRARRG